MSTRIPAGAAVRSKATGTLGRIFRNPDGNLRGHVLVQWDGARDHQTVRIADVTLVAGQYETAKAWENALANGDVHRAGAS
jgi:hypothetical protein